MGSRRSTAKGGAIQSLELANLELRRMGWGRQQVRGRDALCLNL